MKKVLVSFAFLLLTGALCFGYNATPTQKVVDATYTWGKVMRFYGQTDGGCTFGKFNKVHSDSMIGATDSRTLFSHFMPRQGFEYILCRDTLGSYVHVKRDTSTINVMLYAYANDSIPRLVGKVCVDTMGLLSNAHTAGSVPQQLVLPFGQTIIGDYYTLKLECTTAKDSVWTNFFYMYPRATNIGNKILP